MQQAKLDFPFVKELSWVRTDGASAYAGVEFTMGLALMDSTDGWPVGRHHIGASGNNKNSLDAKFATDGQAVERLVNSGKHDADSELALAQALTKIGVNNTTALLFTPDRAYTLKLEPIADLSKMSQRIFVKDATGTTESIRLHQQSGLGTGRVVELANVLVDEEHTDLPAGHLLPIWGAGAQPTAPAPLRPRARGRHQRGLARQQLAVTRRSKKGLLLTKAAIERRRDERRQRKEQEKAAKTQEQRARYQETKEMLYCRYMPGGAEGCRYSCCASRQAFMERHLRGGKHDLPKASTASRICHAAASTLQGVIDAARAAAPQAKGLSMTVPSDGFQVKLLSGRLAELPPPAAGWACLNRLRIRRPSSKMYGYAVWASTLPGGKELKNVDAARMMARVGTADFLNKEFPGDPYAAAALAASGGQRYFKRMELFEYATLKALLTKGAAYCQQQEAKAKASEAKAAAKAAKAAAAKAAAAKAAVTARVATAEAGTGAATAAAAITTEVRSPCPSTFNSVPLCVCLWQSPVRTEREADGLPAGGHKPYRQVEPWDSAKGRVGWGLRGKGGHPDHRA